MLRAYIRGRKPEIDASGYAANGVICFSMDLAGRVKFEAAKKGIYGLARRFCYQPVKFGIVFHT